MFEDFAAEHQVEAGRGKRQRIHGPLEQRDRILRLRDTKPRPIDVQPDDHDAAQVTVQMAQQHPRRSPTSSRLRGCADARVGDVAEINAIEELYEPIVRRVFGLFVDFYRFHCPSIVDDGGIWL